MFTACNINLHFICYNFLLIKTHTDVTIFMVSEKIEQIKKIQLWWITFFI